MRLYHGKGPAGRFASRRLRDRCAGSPASLLRGHADGTGYSPSGSRGQGLLEVPILGHGDLDRLRHDVCPIGAAAEVLRIVVDRSDELDRKTEGHGRELDRRLRLNATSGHWTPSSKLSASARFLEGEVCAVTPTEGPAGAGEVLQGITAELSEPVSGGPL